MGKDHGSDRQDEIASSSNVHAMPEISLDDKTSITLISRVFSLLSINSDSIHHGKWTQFFGDGAAKNTLDFDLAMFNTYVRHIKFLMKSGFQSIMFRLFRCQRADLS